MAVVAFCVLPPGLVTCVSPFCAARGLEEKSIGRSGSFVLFFIETKSHLSPGRP